MRAPVFFLNRRVWALAAAHFLMALATALFNLYLVIHFVSETDYSSLGFVLAARTLPILLVALWGGMLADRFNRAKIATGSLLVAGVLNLATVAVIDTGTLLAVAATLSFLSGLASALGAPALYALLPQIAGESSLQAANGLVRGSRNFATILSPVLFAGINLISTAIAGYLAGISALLAAAVLFTALVRQTVPTKTGPVPTAETDTASDANTDTASAGETTSTGADTAPAGAEAGERGSAPKTALKKQAANYLRMLGRYPALMLTIVFWLCFLPVQAALTNTVLPAEIIAVYDESAWFTIAALLSCGYLLGSVLTGLYEISPRLLLPLSVLFFAAPTVQILLYLWNSAYLLLAISAVLVGLFLELSGVCWGTYLQGTVSEADMGRVSSLDYAASFGLLPVGYAVAGVAMEHLGVTVTLTLGATVCSAGAVLALLIFGGSVIRRRS